jgi:aminoglycoside phosphotransferase (APT) family kinase protein
VNEETEQISKIIHAVLAETPLKVLPLTGKGFVNNVFLVETNRAKFICRTNNENSLDEYEKEKWAAERAAAKQVPTPPILSTGIFDNRAYSIQKYVAGTEGRKLPGDRRFIWKKFGEYAGRIHQIEVGGFGLKFRQMTEGDSAAGWLKYLEYNIESLNESDELLKFGVMTPSQSRTVREIFENLRARRFRFGLNHGDFSLKNTIVDDHGTIHLIDWGSAEASIVPHHELIQLLLVQMQENNPDEAAFAAFLEGCAIDEDEYRLMLPDLKALSLLRAFDKLRWAIDWKKAALKNYISTARATVAKYL